MKKLLTIAMSALMLTSCDFRQSSIPADWVGSWFSADGGWQCSLYEHVALYNNDVWHYQSVTETDSALNVAITNNGRTVNLSLLVKKGDLGRVLGKYYVDGKLIGHVYKNYVQAAAELLPKFDSAAGITPVERVAPKAAVPDGNIGTAVVRLYLRNNLRGPESINGYDNYLTDEYYVSYSNRLELSEKKMQLVESDRYGKMFEAVIPVDGITDFVFSNNIKQVWLRRNYLAEQGDTVMVVVNWQERNTTFGSNRNTFLGFGLTDYEEPFGWMAVTGNYNFGEDTDEEQVISDASAALRDINTWHNNAMRVAPAYSRYYADARNNRRYDVARQIYEYIDGKQCSGKQVSARFMKFVADSFPTADSCVLQSKVAFGTAQSFIPKPFLTLTDSKIDMGILYIDENEARRRGYSQLAIDLFQTSRIAQWMNNNAARIEKFDVYYEKIEGFIAEIKTPDYRNYLEDKYKWFRGCRSYIDRVYSGEKLTDSLLADFAALTDKKFADDLLAIQENLSDYDYALPRVEITVTSHNPGTFYLYDSEYPNVVIDSLYSSRGFYVFHNKLEVGRNYTVKCGGKEKCSFTVTNELFNRQLSFSD